MFTMIYSVYFTIQGRKNMSLFISWYQPTEKLGYPRPGQFQNMWPRVAFT